MKVAGLTGGIGSGKSIVAEIFRTLGVPVFDADAEAKKILFENRAVNQKVAQTFGKIICDAHGMTDRKKLAELVFSDKDKLSQLNSIIHPEVQKKFMEFSKQRSANKYAIKEAAILFETGTYKVLDTVILVTAPAEQKISRVMKRDGLTRQEIQKRMNNQWDDAQKIKRAQHIIVNDEKELLLPQVLRIHELLF